MKTGPGLLPTRTRAIALAMVWPLVLTLGCATKPTQAKRAPYPYPYPPVVNVSEIMRRDAVNARTRELLETGQYKTYREARRAAEKGNPAEVSSADNEQSAEYLRWKKQQAVQSKFEDDLAKMKRKS